MWIILDLCVLLLNSFFLRSFCVTFCEISAKYDQVLPNVLQSIQDRSGFVLRTIHLHSVMMCKQQQYMNEEMS